MLISYYYFTLLVRSFSSSRDEVVLIDFITVFLIKVKASNSRFAQLVDSDELQTLMLQSIADCNAATCSSKHAASTCMIMLRALYSSWKAMSSQPGTNSAAQTGHSRRTSVAGEDFDSMHMRGMATDGSSDPFSGMHGTLAAGVVPPSTSAYGYPGHQNPFAANRSLSGTHTPSHFGNGAFVPTDSFDSFLNDTHFFDSVLISRGADGFFSWPAAEGLEGFAPPDLGNHYL